MANKQRQTLLMLSRPQLIALATQKGVMPYNVALTKTKGDLIALMKDMEGVLKPVKTWEPDDDDILDNDQKVVEELAGTEPGVVADASQAIVADLESGDPS
jgi:hypothetical protein